MEDLVKLNGGSHGGGGQRCDAHWSWKLRVFSFRKLITTAYGVWTATPALTPSTTTSLMESLEERSRNVQERTFCKWLVTHVYLVYLCC
jgi:hypothetical protein